VIDHIAKPPIPSRGLEPWAEQMREIATDANVWCKLSGLITEAAWRTWKPGDFRPYLEVVLESFGPDRLMFGSDWPVCLLSGSYEQVYTLAHDYVLKHASKSEAKIFGENAVRAYRVNR